MDDKEMLAKHWIVHADAIVDKRATIQPGQKRTKLYTGSAAAKSPNRLL